MICWIIWLKPFLEDLQLKNNPSELTRITLKKKKASKKAKKSAGKKGEDDWNKTKDPQKQQDPLATVSIQPFSAHKR